MTVSDVRGRRKRLLSQSGFTHASKDLLCTLSSLPFSKTLTTKAEVLAPE